MLRKLHYKSPNAVSVNQYCLMIHSFRFYYRDCFYICQSSVISRFGVVSVLATMLFRGRAVTFNVSLTPFLNLTLLVPVVLIAVFPLS